MGDGVGAAGPLARAQARPLSPSERYFAFLDPVAPMNLMAVAELATVFPAQDVQRSWTGHAARHAAVRLQVHDDLTLSAAQDSAPPFGSLSAPSAEWDRALARLSAAPFGHGRPAGCHYLYSPQEGRSRLVLHCHHAVVDGRGIARELQLLLRRLGGEPGPARNRVSPPPAERRRHPWQGDRRAYLALLRAVAGRRESVGEPTAPTWRRDAYRAEACRFQTVALDRQTARTLAARARQEGVRVFAALAACWLTAAHRVLYGGRDQTTVELATPVDLRDELDLAQDTAGEVGIVANRYLVGGVPLWTLARSVQDGTAASVQAGEGRLFLDLAGATRIGELSAGVQTVQRMLRAAPPVVSVTNLGVLEADADPEWVTSVCTYLGTTSNHLLFVEGSGYRGTITQSVATNDRQIDPATAAALVAAFEAALAQALRPAT